MKYLLFLILLMPQVAMAEIFIEEKNTDKMGQNGVGPQ
jgi:hypothetical protein